MFGSQIGVPLSKINPSLEPLTGLRIPADIQLACAELDQSIKVKVDLAASVKEIYESEQPMIEQLAKGFKVSADVTLISNVKAAILENIKDEEAKGMA